MVDLGQDLSRGDIAGRSEGIAIHAGKVEVGLLKSQSHRRQEGQHRIRRSGNRRRVPPQIVGRLAGQPHDSDTPWAVSRSR